MTTPYLSLVLTCRNDNHGGNPLERMQCSMDGTLEQLERHRIDSELIVVEWNPPPNRARINDAIRWPKNLKSTTIRFLEVGSHIHQRYPLHKQWGLFSVVAYNAGVLRSRGEFVALAMIDHLHSDELMHFLSRRQLDPKRIYRFPRYNIRREVLNQPNLDAQLAYCRENALQVAQPPKKPLHPSLPPLFTDGCGDFQLLPRKIWHELRGYREQDMMPQHVDSFIHYAAHAMGLREEVRSDLPLYHIDHGDGWQDRLGRKRTIGSLRFGCQYVPPPTCKRDRIVSLLFRLLLLESGQRTAEQLWPYYARLLSRMGRGLRKHDFNGPDWGLSAERLPEQVLVRAAWDQSNSACQAA